MVSVITPSYNSSKFITETIESVIVQSFQDWEMIIVDDASDDDSVSIIKGYVKRDSRIKLVELRNNVGAGEARNKGLEKAVGNYIAFLDSDDVWHKNKLKNQVNFMEKMQAPISFTGYTIMDESLEKIKSIIRVPQSVTLHHYLKTTIIGMSTAIVDRERVGDFKLNPIRSRQDGVLWIELLRKGLIAYGLDQQLTKYRARNNSVSSNKIKAMKRIWYIYRKFAKLNLLKTSYYFSFYIFNNVKRRYF